MPSAVFTSAFSSLIFFDFSVIRLADRICCFSMSSCKLSFFISFQIRLSLASTVTVEELPYDLLDFNCKLSAHESGEA